MYIYTTAAAAASASASAVYACVCVWFVMRHFLDASLKYFSVCICIYVGEESAGVGQTGGNGQINSSFFCISVSYVRRKYFR